MQPSVRDIVGGVRAEVGTGVGGCKLSLGGAL